MAQNSYCCSNQALDFQFSQKYWYPEFDYLLARFWTAGSILTPQAYLDRFEISLSSIAFAQSFIEEVMAGLVDKFVYLEIHLRSLGCITYLMHHNFSPGCQRHGLKDAHQEYHISY